MSEFTFQFPIEELVQRFREAIKEEIAASGTSALNTTKTEPPINTKQLCEFLDITEPTCIRWRKKGKIPFFTIGSAIRYDKNKVVKALEENSGKIKNRIRNE